MSYVLPDFVERMEAELVANEQKGDWNVWKPDAQAMQQELSYHLKKLEMAIFGVSIHSSPGLILKEAEKVKEYAADLANYCMKAYDRFGKHPLEDIENAQRSQPPQET